MNEPRVNLPKQHGITKAAGNTTPHRMHTPSPARGSMSGNRPTHCDGRESGRSSGGSSLPVSKRGKG